MGSFRPATAGARVRALADTAAASASLVVTSPLLVVAALLVRLSGPGPVLTRQPGIGERGERIELVRFRTTAPERAGGVARSAPGEPPLSAVGRLMRVTGIDLLPQLVNLARGDISLFRAPALAARSAA